MGDGFDIDTAVEDEAVDLTRRLVRVDTTNPPGRERAAAELLAEHLRAAGLEPTLLEAAPDRTNVVARVRGTGELPPLLLSAHLDVVRADPTRWRHDPFGGEEHDGCLWGRGAIDMKNMAAMEVALICRLQRAGARLKRDVIFVGVADEEAGCRAGSMWLVDHHADLVRAEYALGEGGGYTSYFGPLRFYPVQVAEKGVAWLRARVRGVAGHGSVPRRDTAVVELARLVALLGRRRFSRRRVDAAAGMLRAVIRGQPLLLRPFYTAALLVPGGLEVVRLVDPALAEDVRALFSNTVTPTMLRAGDQINVIPDAAEVDLDGRTVPGQTTDDLVRELRRALGDEVELETLWAMPPVVTSPVDSPLMDAIRAAIDVHDPGAVCVPAMIAGFTDAKAFTSLGARWYGFAPVRIPRGMDYGAMYHGVDERIPVDGLRWGVRVLADVVERVAGPGRS